MKILPAALRPFGERLRAHGPILAITLLALVATTTSALSLFYVHRMHDDIADLKRMVEKGSEFSVAARTQPPPSAQAVHFQINFKDRPTLGDEKAALTIVEFTDYECPFCNRFHTTTFSELKKRYIETGKARYVVYDLPMRFHKHAVKAAQASRCALEQGKYWEMRSVLFANAKALDPDRVVTYAKQAGLDLTRFRTCFGSDRYLSEIRNDMAAADAVGVTGTPSFLIGTLTGNDIVGRKIVGALPLPVFEKQIANVGR